MVSDDFLFNREKEPMRTTTRRKTLVAPGWAFAIAVAVSLALFVRCSEVPAASTPAKAPPKNIILLIGDGMGFEHLRAASFYAHGREEALFLQSLPGKAQAVTTPAIDPDDDIERLRAANKVPVVDSAAAGTAMATGRKVYNNVLSVAQPGDGSPIPTVLELQAAKGKRTGLVTTAYLTDATPAAFAAHTDSRNSHKEIAESYLTKVRPNIIFGGGSGDHFTTQTIEAANYTLVTDRKSMTALKPAKELRVFGLFAPSNLPYEHDRPVAATQPDKAWAAEVPSLSEMTVTALKLCTDHEAGFFLMIESGLIDKAAHSHETQRVIVEALEFDKTVRLVMEWAAGRDDTIVIVVSDHETGGLKVTEGGPAGQWPTVAWTTGDHTGANVPLYVWGLGASAVTGTMDLTDVFGLMMGTYSPTSQPATDRAGEASVPR